MDYTGTNLYLMPLKYLVYDTLGNNNGKLDRGETANLTVKLKNIGGANFSNLNTILTTNDSYITILDNTGYFGSLMEDSSKENFDDPYVITVSPNIPYGHTIQFSLIANDGPFVDTFFFNMIVEYHYLIWNPDSTPGNGIAVHNILDSLGYAGIYSQTLPVDELNLYQSIFIFLGVWPNKYIIRAESTEAQVLEYYLECLDGRVYLEGGDVWYYDPNFLGGHNFGPIFGINPIADGSNDLGPVVGEPATFTEGMFFNYGGENSFIDRITPTGNGSFLILRDFDQGYGCGVARDAGNYRTVGTSLELGGLIDSIAPSTRAILLDSIMRFFNIKPMTGIAEQLAHRVTANEVRLNVQPSLFRNSLRVRLMGQELRSPIALQIYDVSGRMVKSLVIPESGVGFWSGDDSYGFPLPSGIYFIHYEGSGKRLIKKVVKVN